MELQSYSNIDQLNDRTQIDEVEIAFKYRFPDEFREFIMKYNGSTPSNNILIVMQLGPVVVDHFITFNKNAGEDSIYSIGNVLGNNFFPFAITTNGMLLCFEKSSGRVFISRFDGSELWYVTESFGMLLSRLMDEDHFNRLSGYQMPEVPTEEVDQQQEEVQEE